MNKLIMILQDEPATGWYKSYGSYLLLAALVMSMIALLLVLNRYRIGYKKVAKTHDGTIDPMDPFLGGLTEKMKQQVKELINNSQPALAASIQPTTVPTPSEPDLKNEESPVTHEFTDIVNYIPAPAADPAPNQRLYAKLPADESRFRGDMLVSTQDGEQVYELEINGDTATYRVTENEAAQRYALSENKYLLACAYEQLPSNRNVRIVNDAPGHLSRNGNDWHIDEKVKIKFN